MNYTKEEIKNVVQELLGDNPQGLYINYQFLENDADCFLCSSIEPAFYCFDELDGYDIKCGSSKLCIIPKNTHKDYVIKIPFTGVWDEPVDENGDYYEDGIDRQPVLVGKFNINYIDDEIRIYNSVSSDLQKLLAKNEFVGYYHGIPIYVQERAETIFCRSRYNFGRDEIIANTIMYFKNKLLSPASLCYNFLTSVIQKYGARKAFWIFNELDEFYDDLHDENYGFTKSGVPIIIDYGGYNSAAWSFIHLSA